MAAARSSFRSPRRVSGSRTCRWRPCSGASTTFLLLLSAPLFALVWAPARMDLGTVSGWSLTWFVGSIAFALLTALSLHASFRRTPDEVGRLVKLHSRFVSLACTVTLLYAWNAGWIGLRTWAY